MEVASEFILVAATLMRIKAKMLLPRPVLDDEGNEIDPREELVKHLLEYKKYKALLEDLSKMENDRSLLEKRGNIIKELKSLSQTDDIEWELQNVDLYKLLKVFQKVMDRYKEVLNKPHHKVIQWPYTIETQKKYLLDKLKAESRVSFTQVIDDNPTKMAVIFNFLSILELLQLKIINLHIGIGFNNFWIESFETIQAN